MMLEDREGLIRELGKSPAGHALAWLGLAALTVSAWRLAARCFEGLEAPARPAAGGLFGIRR